MTRAGGMTAADVWAVLGALDEAGVRVWLEGGWGVDALAGRQTRPHWDLDLDLDVRPGSPRRSPRTDPAAPGGPLQGPAASLRAVGGKGVLLLHPLAFDAHGNGVQTGLRGERYVYPAAAFVTGTIDGRQVGCLSAAQQIAWHARYELRDVDRADLAVLHRLAGGLAT